jgi:hypothetical protein
MSALNPVLLNAEFWLLWSVRQLLRGIVISVGMTAAMVTLALFWAASALGGARFDEDERSRRRSGR